MAAATAVPVTVVDAAAERLPLEDGTFDAAVASLVLCSVADPRRALAELARLERAVLVDNPARLLALPSS